MGRWDHSWQSLAVDIVDWSLVLSSELESVLSVCDDEEIGLVPVPVVAFMPNGWTAHTRVGITTAEALQQS